MKITAYFFGGPGDILDRAARGIFENHGGTSIGAGTMLTTGERDVEYEVPDDQAEACRTAIAKAGLRLTSAS